MCCPPQVGKQISQMVRFIKQEAEEKANEIAISAEEVCIVQHMQCRTACVHAVQL